MRFLIPWSPRKRWREWLGAAAPAGALLAWAGVALLFPAKLALAESVVGAAATRAAQGAPDIEAHLEFYPIDVLSRSGRRAAMELRYGGSTSLSHAQVGSLFPPTRAGAIRSTWGIRSRDGLSVKLTWPVTWETGWLQDPYAGAAVVSPDELILLLERGVAATVSEMRYLTVLAPHASGVGDYISGALSLTASADQDLAVHWTASVAVEFFAEYRNDRGELAGTLTSDSWGLPSASAAVELDALPVAVGVEPSSWGAVKSLYQPG